MRIARLEAKWPLAADSTLGRAATRYWEYLVVPALIVLLSVPGSTHLRADQDLHWNDLGYWSSNARNAVLWGQPFQDNYNLALLAPLHYLTARLTFTLAGPSIVTARALGGRMNSGPSCTSAHCRCRG